MKEFIDFLSEHPPYDQLNAEELERLANAVEIEFFSAGTTIIDLGATPLQQFYVVRTGTVEVLDRGRAVDELTTGDTFGHISVLSGLAPPLAVRAVEDTLCYLLPDPKTVLHEPAMLQFSHYGTTIARDRLLSSGRALLNRLERPVSDIAQPILWCNPSDTVEQVAKSMTERRQSCALLMHRGSIGIVTDRDFRHAVAAGDFHGSVPIATIASIPAKTVPFQRTVSAAYLYMVEENIHHLVLVDAQGRPASVARVVDMAAADVRHPLAIQSAIASATALSDVLEACRMLGPTLVELWEAGTPAEHLGALNATMIDAAFRRIISIVNTSSPQGASLVDSSWMLMGSLGRREPLPNSDVDTAMIWASHQSQHANASSECDQILVARRAIDALATCGFSPCPQGLNAFNPLFNRSSEQWLAAIGKWKRNPHDPNSMLMLSVLLDARPITNEWLSHTVQAELSMLRECPTLTRALTHYSTLNRPPTGFIREFVVGHAGDKRQHFNLKKAGLRPIASLARALSFRAGSTSGSTCRRLEVAHSAGFLRASETDTLKSAYSFFYQLATDNQVNALRELSSPESRVYPETLNSLDKRQLREAFRAVSQIQDNFRNRRPNPPGS